MVVPVLPEGLFKTFMDIWSLFKNTYVTIYGWLGAKAFGDFNGMTILIGSGLFFVLGYWIIKWFAP